MQEDIDLDWMNLTLFGSGIELPSSSWIQLDNETRTIKGLTWDSETNKAYQYTLIATDSAGETADLDLTLQVNQPYYKPTHRITVVVDGVFSKFANNLTEQINMYEKLAEAFADQGEITFLDVTEGSVAVSFDVQFDNAMRDNMTCKSERELTKTLFDKGEVSKMFQHSISPYEVKKVSFVPLGDCEDKLEPMEAEILKSEKSPDTEEKDSNFIYIVIGIVVVVVIFFAIILIIFCLKRRKQKSKPRTYIEKGIPVVFDEERKSIDSQEPQDSDPLMEENRKPKPPAYPQNGKESIPLTKAGAGNSYQPPTPPVSEHEHE